MRNPFGSRDDDSGVRRRRLDDRTADSVLSGRPVEAEAALSAFVAQSQALVPTEPPTPSDALAVLLEHGVPPSSQVTATAVLPRRTPWADGRVRVGLAGATVLALVLSAAAANSLPAPAQNAVADVVGWVTPLHLPRPAEPTDHVVPTPTPTPTVTPSQQESPGASPRPEQSSEPSHEAGTNEGTSESGSGESPRPGSGTEGSPGDGSSGSESGAEQATPAPTTATTTEPSREPSGSDGGSSSPTPSSSESPSDGG